MIEQYLDEYEKIQPLGKTKNATLKAIKDTWLGDLDDSELTSQKLVEFAQWRMSKEGGDVQAQTVLVTICRTWAQCCLSLGRHRVMKWIRWLYPTHVGCYESWAW